jgi:hypothetical protein
LENQPIGRYDVGRLLGSQFAPDHRALTASVKAKSLFDTLDMPQKPDGLRNLDQVKRELCVWVPSAHDA